MPKLREVIAGTKTKIYCQGSIFRRRVLAALRTVRQGLTMVGNQTKPLKCSGKKKVVFGTSLERIFKRMATDLSTQPITTQQSLTFALNNTRLLPDGCCRLNNTDNKIIFIL
jgi:hypothetical protein